VSEILPSCSWDPGTSNLSQNDLNYPTYDSTQNLKIVLQTRHTESFEGLNSSLAQSTGKLWSCKVAQNSMRDFEAWYICTPVSNVLTPWRLGGFGDFRKKTAVFGCLTNALAPPPIVLESCSKAQTDPPV